MTIELHIECNTGEDDGLSEDLREALKQEGKTEWRPSTIVVEHITAFYPDETGKNTFVVLSGGQAVVAREDYNYVRNLYDKKIGLDLKI